MAWKVIGCMHGRDKVGKLPPVYGPLPRKVWVKAKGDKKNRMPKATNALGKSDTLEDAKMLNGRHAVAYARWLAARDGVALPEGGAAPRFEPVIVPGRKSPELRVSAVIFYHPLPAQLRGPRARGMTQAEAAQFAPVTVNIPNWDWVPCDPVETVDALPERDEVDSMFEFGFRNILQEAGLRVTVMGDGFQMVA